MTTALLYLAGSTLILVCIAVVFRIEDARGSRFNPFGVRSGLDFAVRRGMWLWRYWTDYFSRSVLRALFHYSAHSVLKLMYGITRDLNAKVERLLRQNRKMARQLRDTQRRTHLDEIAAHKEATALSEEEKLRLREHH